MQQNNANKNGDNHERKKPKHDPLSGLTGGLILILLGVLFLLTTMDYLSWSNWWQYFLLGLGAILILEGLIRLIAPRAEKSVTGKLIGGSILLIIGASFVYGLVTWWPLILIAVGIIIIVTGFVKSKG
jgi:uncharacterized protein YjeT (DUF2065 family)